jgi:hypothetical protein
MKKGAKIFRRVVSAGDETQRMTALRCLRKRELRRLIRHCERATDTTITQDVLGMALVEVCRRFMKPKMPL